jgi:hypothetical protein
MPIKMAALTSPLKYNISEKISERKAAINNNLSVVVNFLNMTLKDLKFCMIILISLLITKKNGYC